jgi:hypothetical protein
MEEEKNKAEEPETKYPAKKITFFSSFEEANEFDARERANRTPEENLQLVTGLIQQLYADELKDLRNPYKTINFISCEYLS